MTSKAQIVDQAHYWRNIELPDTWPDDASLKTPRHLLQIFHQLISGKTGRVSLPDQLPGKKDLPKYLFQEFHSLPNGNYSKRIASGYIHSFDTVMLGTVRRERRALAQRFAGCRVAVDIGCGGGHMARALKDAGVDTVWGVEPSPYLLQLAAKENPGINLIQGIAEATGLPDNCADLVSLCFVFHEVPPRYANQALREIHRILKPGGHLVFIEPSPDQLELGKWQLFRQFGWRGLYFSAMARKVFEPFIRAWHGRDIDSWLSDYGFQPLENRIAMPLRTVVAKRADH